MFNFNSKSFVNKKIKISDINKQISVSKEARLEEKNINCIVLTNVLSSRTLNCPDNSKFKELYVFEIELESKNIPICFIKELDDSIKFPTLFIIRNSNDKLGYITYKHGIYKGKYYQTIWNQNSDFELPLGANVDEIYKFVLSKFMKYPPFSSEIVDDYIKRNMALNKLDFQINSTSIAIAKENQSKKKFEFNSRLKKYKEERNNLLEEK